MGWQLFLIAAVLTAASPFLYAYHVTNRHLKSIPGPLLASYSNLWLFFSAKNGRILQDVDQAHKKYGKLVRLQPGHVSIHDDAALTTIYNHGTPLIKG